MTTREEALERAVKLILSLDTDDSTSLDTVRLAPKTREQLEDALGVPRGTRVIRRAHRLLKGDRVYTLGVESRLLGTVDSISFYEDQGFVLVGFEAKIDLSEFEWDQWFKVERPRKETL